MQAPGRGRAARLLHLRCRHVLRLAALVPQVLESAGDKGKRAQRGQFRSIGVSISPLGVSVVRAIAIPRARYGKVYFDYIINNTICSSCEIEHFVENHLCNLCVTPDRAYYWVSS